jgi:hypothetical protein
MRILRNATVDPEVDDPAYVDYTVVVSGAGEHDSIVRTYTITDQTQRGAAMEGIRRFTEELAE